MPSKHYSQRGNEMSNKYVYPTEEERKAILDELNEPYDRLVREDERKRITSLSRSSVHRMELKGRFPARRALTEKHCAWLLSDLMHWMRNIPEVENVHNPYANAHK
ncbi:helix-turn-helix transcriptional regulator [Symbiopectobacterium sp. Eva_TO]